MTPAQAQRLFQPFTQADASTTRKFGGTGLGLNISRRLAQMLGGDVTLVHTEQGKGTHFRVTIATGPLQGVSMVSDPHGLMELARKESANPSADEDTLAQYRILLAEDGPDNQRLIAHVLRKFGAQVAIVENGALAVETALSTAKDDAPFDVVLMDMQMPVMDGYEAAELLRQRGYTGAIVALTAHAMASDRQKCLLAGCDDYATKPINRSKLIAAIQRSRQARTDRQECKPASCSSTE